MKIVKKLILVMVSLLVISGCSSGKDTSEQDALLEEMLLNAEVERDPNMFGDNEIYTLTNHTDLTFKAIYVNYEIYDANGVKLQSRSTNVRDITPGQKFQVKLTSFTSDADSFKITSITTDVFK